MRKRDKDPSTPGFMRFVRYVMIFIYTHALDIQIHFSKMIADDLVVWVDYNIGQWRIYES